jgi:multidrug efflux pump
VIRFYLPLAILPPSDHHSQIVVMATDLDARLRLEEALDAFLVETFPEAVVRVSPLEMGPPIGWPLQYRVSGPDVEVLRTQALRLAEVVASDPGARRVHFDWIEPARQLVIDIDQDQARRLGLTSAQLSNVLNTAVSGTTVTQLRDDIYLVNVIARAEAADRVSLDGLATLQVPVPGGRTVALSSFATFDFTQEQPLVWRRDRVPTLTVLADVGPGLLPETVVAALEDDIAALNADLPFGYRIEVGGTAETSAESQEAVFAVVPLMAFLMLTLLMLQLQSFRLVGIVVFLLPLGLIGVVGALLALRPAARLRRDPRHPRADRDDREERDHPHHPDQGRARQGARRARGGGVGVDEPAPAASPHRHLDGARAHPHRAHAVLGADGLRDHGRAPRGDRADAHRAAGALRHALRRPARPGVG